MSYQCPICFTPLTQTGHSYQCQQQHCFDLAKEGYVNLMPVQFKRSKIPGDSPLMMQARREFLQAGFYAPLCESAATLLVDYGKTRSSANAFLDIGCGEGYYTHLVAEKLQQQFPSIHCYGLDIAKNAVKSAAKSYKNVNFCVGSSYRLPFADESLDLLMRIYAPSEANELHRVLTPEGLLIAVTPAPMHLQQYKALIYDNVRLHSEELEEIKGFTIVERKRLTYQIELDNKQRINLLQMTPFAWRANEHVIDSLTNCNMLFNCDIDFYITVYKRQTLCQ